MMMDNLACIQTARSAIMDVRYIGRRMELLREALLQAFEEMEREMEKYPEKEGSRG